MTDASHYTVLARRFRPQQFGDVVGQEHISQALQNAIRSGRVAHAYLFTGARGVGKTSTARILAKALNCPQATDAIPCGECDICKNISAGNDVDVLEIDGASNRRIDDIRDIRANVSVKSMRSKYKVYIIDEVHMLTTEAFNALLKTLEEPPPNVKFVFCTTEPQKVPDTILSRCQRFDFSTIETASITGRLKQIAEAEGYSVTDDALDLVARRAAGSMRDSQSLFDQLLAFGEKELSAEDVHKLLGTADDDRLTSLYDALVDRNPQQLFERLDEALTSGVQLGEFFNQLVTYARDLLIVASGANRVSLQSVFDTQRETLRGQAEKWGLQTIVTALQILSEAKTQMSRSVNARSIAELALMRLTQLGELHNLSAALQLVASGKPIPVSSGAVTSSTRVSDSREQPYSAPAQKKSVEPVEIKQNDAVIPPQESFVTIELEESNRDKFWAQVTSIIDDKIKPHLSVCDDTAIFGPNRLELSFKTEYDLSRRYCEKPDNLKVIESTVSRLAGRPVQVRVKSQQVESNENVDSIPSEETKPTPLERSQTDLSSVDDEYVRSAAEFFGASLVKVQPIGGASPNQ